MLLFTLLLSLTAFAEDRSLFFQDEARVRQEGAFACRERPIGQRIREVKNLCGVPLEAWRGFVLSLLELPRYPNRDTTERDLKDAVARNNRITEAYAQLYLLGLQTKPVCGRSVFPWVGGASLGSLKSGQVMRSGLSAYLGEIPAFDRLADGNYRPRFEKRFTPAFANYALRAATLTLGEGNRAIFTDLYWQLLAGTVCGPAEVLRTIHAVAEWEKDEKLVRSAKAWDLLAQAGETCDEATVVAANKTFVEVEQYLVGQPAMYEGLGRQFGGWALSPMIEPAVPAALGTFPTFTEHAAQTTPRFLISFADPEQRVPWMKDQLAVMESEFQAKADFMPALYCAVVKDSLEAERVVEGL